MNQSVIHHQCGVLKKEKETYPSATTPQQKVVGQVPRDFPSLFQVRGQRFPEQCNVLVVPGIAIGDSGAIGNGRNLVAVCRLNSSMVSDGLFIYIRNWQNALPKKQKKNHTYNPTTP
jgi:hypothetical protein